MNKLNISRKLVYSCIALLGFMPAMLSASNSETLSLDGINSNYLEQLSVTYLGHTSTDYVGGVAGSLNGGASQFFFCYDISHQINVPGTYSVNLFGPTSSFPSYLGLPNTFNLQVASSLLSNVNPSSFTNVNQYAGLQLAIWSVLYNWTPTSQSTRVNGANFSTSATGNVITDAQAFLAQAEALVNSGQYVNTDGVNLLVNSSDSQDNVIQTLAGVTVPEPSTYLILGSALFAAAICAKRRQLQSA